MDDPQLADALLRMELAWASLAATVVTAPGLTDEQIDAQLEGTGLELPPPLRQWWRWKDGAGEAVYQDRRGYFTSQWSALPLHYALQERRERLDQPPEPYVWAWDPAWISVCGQNGGYVTAAVDTRTSDAFSLSYEDPYLPADDERAPFVTTVLAWAQGLEDGTYRWDEAHQIFTPDQTQRQRHPLVRTGLV